MHLSLNRTIHTSPRSIRGQHRPKILHQIFAILEAKVLPGISKAKGRPGLTLWQILVLGIVRHARDCDYDQLEDLAAHHSLIRQFLGLPAIAGSDLTNTPDLSHKTISNNVSHITEEILQDINKIIAQHGHNILSKKTGIADKIIAKTDTYVLQTNVHFPTDINLLWDAARKTIDLIERRILNGENIPHSEKTFSLFEPHTQWISKGKAGCPVELGQKLLIITDQNHIIIDYQILASPDEHPQAPATIQRIKDQYGSDSIQSISFDKGYSSAANKAALKAQVSQLIMPKKGKRNAQETAEEHEAGYIKLRHAHSAIESNINSLEHHGLARCRDKGKRGYGRCVGLGVLAYNLHQIGNGIQARAEQAQEKARKKRVRAERQEAA